MIVFDATNDEQQDVFNEMDTISIFDDDKMIVLENATFLSSKNTTKYDIQGFIDRSTNDESVILVFCCPSDKLDTRKRLLRNWYQSQLYIHVLPWMKNHCLDISMKN